MANRAPTARLIELQDASATIDLSDCPLLVGRADDAVTPVSLGLPANARFHTIRHRGLGECHALIQRDDEGVYRLKPIHADGSNTLVDGHAVSGDGCDLPDGCVMQLGPLAWRLETARARLVPVPPINGFDLDLNAFVPGRLTHTQLKIRSGQMTALVGPSGCGKSTLLETIRDRSGLSCDVSELGDIYFVPQRDLVHQDLRLGDALRSIGRIYGRDVLPFEIDAALDSVGLSKESRNKFPGQLSGGQLRRFRIAGALLSGAGVIVLDEPDSGLDHETADEVIGLLRSLAVRGATIVAVTHHRHVLESFDRIIRMQPTPDGGQVIGEDTVVDESGVSDVDLADAASGAEPSRRRWFQWRNYFILLRREQQKITSPSLAGWHWGPIRIPSCMIALVVVPLLFAIAIAWSVPTDPNRNLSDGLYGDMPPMIRLGFLAVVSVIWMSASQSHLSIVRDRELYDYELSHGIGWGDLLLAKSKVLSIAGMLQTTVFAIWLTAVRYVWLDRSFFVDERWTQWPGVLLCLLTVSIAATALGLFISAIAGRAALLAAAILPVVMMFQILFSAPFAVPKPDRYEPLADYEQLTIVSPVESDPEAEDDWESDWDDDAEENKPLFATSLVSYATLSRYGDKWLRAMAVTTEPPERATAAQVSSAISLVGITLGATIATWLVLVMQTTRLGIRPMKREQGRASRSAAVAKMLALCWCVGLITWSPPVTQAQEAVETRGMPNLKRPRAKKPLVIELRLVQGKYDESKLREAFGGTSHASPVWREFDNQDRFGLAALELMGKIEFEASDEGFTIRLKDMPKWDLMKQLAPPRLIGADEIAEDAREDVILFVHGLEGGESTFDAATELLEKRGIASMRFDYPNDGPPDEVGRRLAEQLTEFHGNHPGVRVHIVAHSLGGLVSTWAVTEVGFPVGLVPNVFTLGTPFGGSSLASFHDELELFDVAYRLATATPGALDTVHDGRGEAATALVPGSPFLRQLQQRKLPAGTKLHLAAGTKSFLEISQRKRLALELPAELARLAVDDPYAKRVVGLLSAGELRDGQGDGAVTVKSALDWADRASLTTFPLTHLGLVSEPAPLEWVLETAGIAKPVNPAAK